MREEQIIENLHKTVLQVTEIMKDLIQTNEALEEENRQLLEKITMYEGLALDLRNFIKNPFLEDYKENKF
jgi:Na+/phosphate symporter